MKVSVIIPAYNAEPYLRSCLDSVLGQTLDDIEVVCVDDGSTDGTHAILAGFAANDARVKLITQPNSGLGAARNRGLEAAVGEYAQFLDADDELASADALERLVVEAEREQLDALFFDAETRINDDLGMQSFAVDADGYIRQKDYSKTRTGRELFFLMLKNKEYSASSCLALFMRKFLEKEGIRFPEARIFHEDNIFTAHVMLAAERAGHRPWRLYVRKIHAGSIVTSKPGMQHLRGYLACYCDVCELLSREGWDKRTRAALRDRRAVYKLHVRRLAEANPELVSAAKGEMSEAEYIALREVLVYPFREKVVNTLRCLRDRGFFFTVKRILCGRQDT